MLTTNLTKKWGLIILWAVILLGSIGILLTPDSTFGLLDIMGIEKSLNIKIFSIILLIIVGIVTSLFVISDKEK
jgi:hypothetical protein